MPYSFLDLAKEVLKRANSPLTYEEIWETGVDNKLDVKVGSKGKTPNQSLGARLYTDTKKPETVFLKVGSNPARFWLKERRFEINDKLLENSAIQTDKAEQAAVNWKERDLHPILAYFCYANINFNKGRSIYTKTLFHEKSQKNGVAEWIHPDMVGVQIPLDDWNQEVFDLAAICADSPIRLFSFEIKKQISRLNYRESFFQALSNSAWANEAYLVTAKITEDEDLKSEIERLCAQFGVGVILLNLDDIDSSVVWIHPKRRINLDWESINKLCTANPDFLEFMKNVKIDYNGKKMHLSEYDKILDDPDQYLFAHKMNTEKSHRSA